MQYAPFATRPRREQRPGAAGQSDEERQATRLVEQALTPAVQLDRFPKSVIEVHCMVLEAAGGEVTAAVTGASLALAEAGIDMADLCTATVVAGVRPPAAAGAGAASASAASSMSSAATRLLVDPSAAEVAASSFCTTIAMMPRIGLLTLSNHAGEAVGAELLDAIRLAMDGCATILQQMRKILVDSATKKLKKAANLKAAPESTASGSSSIMVEG